MREPSIPVSTTATWTPLPVSPARESVGTPSLRATSAVAPIAAAPQEAEGNGDTGCGRPCVYPPGPLQGVFKSLDRDLQGRCINRDDTTRYGRPDRPARERPHRLPPRRAATAGRPRERRRGGGVGTARHRVRRHDGAGAPSTTDQARRPARAAPRGRDRLEFRL